MRYPTTSVQFFGVERALSPVECAAVCEAWAPEIPDLPDSNDTRDHKYGARVFWEEYRAGNFEEIIRYRNFPQIVYGFAYHASDPAFDDTQSRDWGHLLIDQALARVTFRLKAILARRAKIVAMRTGISNEEIRERYPNAHAHALAYRRSRLDLSLEQAAADLDMTPDELTRIESGDLIPTDAQLVRISDRYRWSLEKLREDFARAAQRGMP